MVFQSYALLLTTTSFDNAGPSSSGKMDKAVIREKVLLTLGLAKT